MQPARSRAKSDINITPLIDIVLVLLIVFIVMVPSLAKSLGVVVPRVVQEPVDRPKDDIPVVLTLDKEGKLFLQREEISLATLVDQLVPPVSLQPLNLRKVFLKVSGDLPHERAVQVLDQIQVASERLKRETLAKAGYDEVDGGPIKVAITLLKES